MKKMLAGLSVVALTALSTGCADLKVKDGGEKGKAESARAARESSMQQAWSGKPYDELLASLGKPELTMSIPRYGWPPSEAILYGMDSGSGCIDAFLVVHGGEEGSTVMNYFCR